MMVKEWLRVQKKTRLPVQWATKNMQSVPSIELPEQLTHLLAVVIHLTLLVGCLHLWCAGTCLIQRAQAI